MKKFRKPLITIRRPKNVCFADMPVNDEASTASERLQELFEPYGYRFLIIEESVSETLNDTSVYVAECPGGILTYRSTRFETTIEGHAMTQEQFIAEVEAQTFQFEPDDGRRPSSVRIDHKYSGNKYLGLSVIKFVEALQAQQEWWDEWRADNS